MGEGGGGPDRCMCRFAWQTQQPLLLRDSISTIVEAVIKILDPSTVSSMRETLLTPVTTTLRDLVDAYPMVDFNDATQRMVVGSADGFIIVYDLKTATRLHVLEVCPPSENRPLARPPQAHWSGWVGGVHRGTRRGSRRWRCPRTAASSCRSRLATAPSASGRSALRSWQRCWETPTSLSRSPRST